IEVNKADNIKQIIVSDILGKKLIEINPNSLGHQQNIDVSKLTSGEYNIRIKTEVGIINKKILKR
ncbi:MAG TPA: T9SS type A sorting domain-containing protein, partial [Bacteroidia bacterium]|nr:T9SS type A sorting domain-containing protein [Bacteroidia bacterium]